VGITKRSLLLALFLCLLLVVSTQAQTLEQPVLTTTCGQSPGALMVRQLAMREGLQIVQDDLATADLLREKYEAGEGFKTLIITMGTSGKGLGAAGIDMDFEEKRIMALIAEAKRQGMVIIGVHIEGEERRVDAADERSIEIVAPESDILIVRTDSNKDNFFTKLAEEKNIPLYVVEKSLQMAEPLRELFGLE
jgi:hypothetical protein